MPALIQFIVIIVNILLFHYYRLALIKDIGIVVFMHCFVGGIDDHNADDIVSVAP